MKPYKIINDSMLNMLSHIEENSIDCVITDPPYELGFMGKSWDSTGIVFNPKTWEKCFKALKPGGYLLAFGGSRTFHRIACAIEDAGFELRDTILYLYGSGFPKSMDVSKSLDKHLGAEREVVGKDEEWIKRVGKNHNESNTYTDKSFGMVGKNGGNITVPSTKQAKQWQGWGTNLKPAFEPIIMARKPFKTSVAENIMQYGVGGINIDECRVEYVNDKDKEGSLTGFKEGEIQNTNINFNASPLIKPKDISELPNGRFPANIILGYLEDEYLLKENITKDEKKKVMEWLNENA